MRYYILRRIIQIIPVLIGIIFILFYPRTSTGYSVSYMMHPRMTPEQKPNWRKIRLGHSMV